jgi:hypothetical protein
MPKAFDDCVKAGGRVRSKKLSKTHYIPICFPKGGGDSVAGHKKAYKKILKGGKKK